MADISIEELRRTMPWREVVHPNGIVQMIDKNGKEVPLFSITGLLKVVTEKMALR